MYVNFIQYYYTMRKILRKATIINYISVLNKIHKKYNFGNGLTLEYEFIISELLIDGYNVNNLRKYKEIFDWFKYVDAEDFINDNYGDIPVIYSIIIRIDDIFFKSLTDLILPHMKEKQCKYEISRILKTKPDCSINFSDITEIKSKLSELNMENGDRLLYGLYMLFPPRRAIDYRRMICRDFDTDGENWYLNGMFYFNVTKNNIVQKYVISSLLNEIICEYLSVNRSKYLLGKKYNQSELSNRLSKLFTDIYGIPLTVTKLRRLFATNLSTTEINITDRRIQADKMNHTISENYRYVYYNLK